MTHTLSWSARAASCDPPKAQKKGVREHAGRVALRCVWLGVEGLGGIENSQDELHAPGLLHAHSQERALAGRNKPDGLAPSSFLVGKNILPKN